MWAKPEAEFLDWINAEYNERTGWIPVSEGLPEGYDQYLCYCEDGLCLVYWLDDEPWAEETVESEGILAWQPLPEPYKGGDAE